MRLHDLVVFSPCEPPSKVAAGKYTTSRTSARTNEGSTVSFHIPQPPEQPSNKPSAKQVFTHPAFFVIIAIVAIGIWFGSGFLKTASNPTPENSINYYGVAEVLDVGSNSKRCIVEIRRDDGSETRQHMAKSDCGKMHVGDMIRIKNGQYESTIQNYPAPHGTLK